MKVDIYEKTGTIDVRDGDKLIDIVDLDDGMQTQKEIKIHTAPYRGLHQFFGPNEAYFAIVDDGEGFELSKHVEIIESENVRYENETAEQGCKIYNLSNYAILLKNANLFQRIFKWKSLLSHKPK
jgi:hypothetical protein